MASTEPTSRGQIRPTLDSLPSEIRRLIVSFLAPAGSERATYARNGKLHLKQANLAHQCLREWVPEFMFRDMSLLHVSVDNASHLERFAISTDNARLLKHVKTIQVKVPPAIRWELNSENPFDSIEDITKQRLLSQFNVKSPSMLNDSQEQYCQDYHRALVQPFTQNRRWYVLQHLAWASWRTVFTHFPNLVHISIGVCGRTDHPAPTYTNTFVNRYGDRVEDEARPRFVEDSIVNQAWGSSAILSSVPESVKSLQLSMANLDNLNSFATVNRLLSYGYNRFQVYPTQAFQAITTLTLYLRGPDGIHGTRVWLGDTGSAGMCKYWRKMLTSMNSLSRLDMCIDMERDVEAAFTELEETDSKGCILSWLLEDLVLAHLHTLSFRHFMINRNSLVKIFAKASNWPNLKVLELEEIRLLMNEEPEGQDHQPDHLAHLQGESWLHACQSVTNTIPGLSISLIQPISTIDDIGDYQIHPKYAGKISQMPNAKVDLSVEPIITVWLSPIEEFTVKETGRDD